MSITILVVDDDIDDIDLFKEAVEDMDKSVNYKSTVSAMEALSILDSRALVPDIIVVDFNMPLLNGAEFIQAVRENPDYDSIKLFLYSTCDLNQIMTDRYKIHIDGFFRKPTTFDGLRSKVSDLLALCNPSKINR